MFDWVIGFIERSGYVGVMLLMFAENVFPPIPSELIMPLAGFTAARGEMNIFVTVLVGSAGSLLGATLWYYLGKWIGSDRLRRFAGRHGRWLTVRPRDVDNACAWFGRHGTKAVFIGRLVPAVRTLISVPAGLSGMKLLPFLIYSGLGTVVWTAILAGAGFFLESQYRKVADWLNPVSNVVIAVLVLWYIYRLVTFRNKESPSDKERF